MVWGLFRVGFIVHLGVYLGLISKKKQKTAEKREEAEGQRSRKAKKQGNRNQKKGPIPQRNSPPFAKVIQVTSSSGVCARLKSWKNWKPLACSWAMQPIYQPIYPSYLILSHLILSIYTLVRTVRTQNQAISWYESIVLFICHHSHHLSISCRYLSIYGDPAPRCAVPLAACFLAWPSAAQTPAPIQASP